MSKKTLGRWTSEESVLNGLDPPYLCLIHGDLHSANILYDPENKRYLLVDPRGRSPAGSIYCDIAYDWAKLVQDYRAKLSHILQGTFETSSRLDQWVPEIAYRFDKDDPAYPLYEEIGNVITSWMVAYSKETKDPLLVQRTDLIEALLCCSVLPFLLRDEGKFLTQYSVAVEKMARPRNLWVKGPGFSDGYWGG